MSECRRYRVLGRVQGVWFRESTRQQAELRGISGFARNCSDGSVEVLACGESADLDELSEWLLSGPPMATVEKVEEQAEACECPPGFTTA